MIEKIYTFGKDNCLVGVVTEPDADTKTSFVPAVLILNAGLLPRIGPYRLHVDLARNLAAQGFTVLRFDLSGIGDSATRQNNEPNEQRAVSDVRDAMDFLARKTDICEFVLVGLCSGANNAYKVAVADSRICGTVFLDGYAYRTWRHYLWHYGPRLASLRKWKNLIRWILEAGFRGKTNMWVLPLPPKEDIRAGLVALAEREVNLLFVYTGGSGSYSYRDQFKDAFGSIDFRGRLHLEYFKEADHTYTLLQDRERLVTAIRDWMQDTYQLQD